MVGQVTLPGPRLPWPNRSQPGESVAPVPASGLCARPLATAIVSATHLPASALRRLIGALRPIYACALREPGAIRLIPVPVDRSALALAFGPPRFALRRLPPPPTV